MKEDVIEAWLNGMTPDRQETIIAHVLREIEAHERPKRPCQNKANEWALGAALVFVVAFAFVSSYGIAVLASK
jgi:hypothetical protein